MATIIPLFTFDGFILIFGISTLFFSDKLSFIKKLMEPISSFIIDILDLLYFNVRLENKDIKVQLFVLMVIIAITFLILYIIYVMLGLLNKSNLKKPYFFEGFRYVFYAVISILIGFYSISGIGFLMLFLGDKYTFNEGALYINIISLIAIGGIYVILEYLYRYKLKNIYNNIDKEDNNKNYEKEETTSKQSDIIEVEKLNLLSKMKDFFKDIENNEETNINKEINKENKLSLDKTVEIDTKKVKEKLYNMDHTVLLNQNLNEYDVDTEIIKKFNSKIINNKEKDNIYQDSSKDIEKYFTLSILNEKENLNNEEDKILEDDYYQISFADLEEDNKENNFINNSIEFKVDENEQFNFLSMISEEN
ncbi:hypothetical protein GBZ86_03865 [Clostridium tarantellae]|uniref:Uncharacterized protein n=1 Tax=Clostridium tarantellae TaxID=39493 RepID=A0A6I1MPT7_9CLOT|nr:hypothetical protein [Clostridium tarantellae]